MKTPWRAAVGLAAAFAVLHAPFVPVSLEDLDSMNFALGVRHFDVAQHQPHPPGYPVFILLAKVASLVVPTEVRALGVISLLGGAAAAAAAVALFAAWTGRSERPWLPVGAAVVTATAPLFWITAARPLSDAVGLAAALAALALAVQATTPAGLATASLIAGLGAGVRSQVVWLTVPALVFAAATLPRADRRRAAVAGLAAYGAGALAWAIPLVVLSGGPAAYVRALTSQGTEDFSGVAMLATRPSPRLLLSALHSTWLAPWGPWPLGAAVLAAAAAGAARLARLRSRTLVWLAVAFGPYALFDMLFQETATTRYALPLVVPVAYLAVSAGASLAGGAGVWLTAAVAAAGLVTTAPALAAYARTPAPAFQVLADMSASAPDRGGPPPVLAMHRRQELDMRRPLAFERDRLPQWSAHLPAPPKHEWLELVKYWNSGGRATVWYLADPPRSDVRLIDPHALSRRRAYRWPFADTDLIGGVRPNVMDWYRIEPPGWYVGEGWALTPETAGVARDEGRGPGRGPIAGWVRRRPGPAMLMIGGRNLAGGGPDAPVTVTLDGAPVLTFSVPPGFFLKFQPLPAGALDGAGDYASLTVTAGTAELAVEQFDVQSRDLPVFGFGDGWLELEYNPVTGRLWRWTTERATLRLWAPRQALTLRLGGEFETGARSAHVVFRVGDRTLAERDVPRRFDVTLTIPADVVSPEGETTVTIETDQWYVPAETNWRPTQDRRHLGLRIFEWDVRPAS